MHILFYQWTSTVAGGLITVHQGKSVFVNTEIAVEKDDLDISKISAGYDEYNAMCNSSEAITKVSFFFLFYMYLWI